MSSTNTEPKNHGVIRYNTAITQTGKMDATRSQVAFDNRARGYDAQEEAHRYGYYPMVANRTDLPVGKNDTDGGKSSP